MVLRSFFNRPHVPEVTAEETKTKQKAGALIVDVREAHEWRDGHIPGAKHIPLGSLASRLHELDTSREVITVCHSGHRSLSAAAILHNAGFSQASSMAGGMMAWMRQRYPVSNKS